MSQHQAYIRAGFSQFLTQQGELLHCTAHSHHPWPDCTRGAQLQAWQDAAMHTDAKWDKVFDSVIPEAEAHIARELHLSEPRQITFAPNTHEFVARLYSCLDWRKPLSVLTTAHEFHSFNRQTRRLEETGQLKVTRLAAAPFSSFSERLAQAARAESWDMVWLSQVHFDSGFVMEDLAQIVEALPAETLLVVDGYHAFMAMPVDLSRFEERLFYLAGGYKYAMAGEGACFMQVPRGCELRPAYTGWYADFEGLSQVQGQVGYAENGSRFLGATFDPSGLYRFNAVQRWLKEGGITTGWIRAHVQALQQQLVEELSSGRVLNPAALVPPLQSHRGNFLTFDLLDAEQIEQQLRAAHIRVDRRGTRLRFGFGLYHDEAFVERLLARLTSLHLI